MPHFNFCKERIAFSGRVIAKKRGDVDCLTDEGDLSGDPLGMGEPPEQK